MRILLVGEYSRLHNSLKEGLQALGHEVKIIGTGDYFKKLPVDIQLTRKWDTGINKKIKVGVFRLFKIDLTSRNLLKQFLSFKDDLKGFDIVQLINENSLGMQAREELQAIKFLKNHNKYIFLLSCGTDYSSVSYAIDQKIRYSIFTPFLEERIPESHYRGALRFLKPEFRRLHHYLYNKVIEGVIASDMDYHLPLINHPKYLGLIPNPINIKKLKFNKIEVKDKVIIFIGINRTNFYKKGMDFFETALEVIQQKYTSKVIVITAENLAYKEYIEKYNSAHILLDQVYSFDQGYNALEAMSKGKVVFTGAEKEWQEFYGYRENEICINAIADTQYLINKLSWLIENPIEIKRIGENARKFIEDKHNYIKIAELYLNTWKAI